MHKGYILLHRQLENNWLWTSEPFTKGQAWVDLLLLASHSGSSFFIRGNKVDLKAGEIGHSKEQLASRWKWSRKKVLNFLKMLEKEQQITQQKTACLVIVKVVNYEKFQKKEQQTTQQKNNRRTTEEHIQIMKKNDKNDKEINIPDFVDKDLWNDFLKMRKSMKKKPTAKALEIVINKLKKIKKDGLDPNQALENSIVSNWVTVYPPKNEVRKQNRDIMAEAMQEFEDEALDNEQATVSDGVVESIKPITPRVLKEFRGGKPTGYSPFPVNRAKSN